MVAIFTTTSKLIFKYPKGQKLIWSGSSTTSHLPLFGGARAEQGEMICGTGGTVHITIGDGKMDPNPPMAIWYKEPSPPPKVTTGGKPEKFQAGASFSWPQAAKSLPILLGGDEMKGSEGFLEKEMKFARRWLYQKASSCRMKQRNPVTVSLESFFNDCKSGETRRPTLKLAWTTHVRHPRESGNGRGAAGEVFRDGESGGSQKEGCEYLRQNFARYRQKGVSGKANALFCCYFTEETAIWSPCMLPSRVTGRQSPPVLELACWRKVPFRSSIIYNRPFDIRANEEVSAVTLQSLYFSRTVVH